MNLGASELRHLFARCHRGRACFYAPGFEGTRGLNRVSHRDGPASIMLQRDALNYRSASVDKKLVAMGSKGFSTEHPSGL